MTVLTLVSALIVLRAAGVCRVVVVDGSSMYPTLKRGDTLLVSRLPYGVGDVVVAHLPDGTPVVKRIDKIRGNDVSLMGDNPSSDSYTVRRQDVFGRQVFAALATHRYLQDSVGYSEEALSTQESKAGLIAFDRKGSIFVREGSGRAKRAVRGSVIGWAGRNLVFRSEGRYGVFNPGTGQSTALGLETGRHQWFYGLETVAYEDEGYVWAVDGQLGKRILWRGELLTCVGDSVRGIRVGSEAVELVNYSPQTGRRLVETSLPKRVSRVAGELDILHLVRSGQANMVGSKTCRDLDLLFDGDVSRPSIAEACDDTAIGERNRWVEFTLQQPVMLTGYDVMGLFTASVKLQVAGEGGEYFTPNISSRTDRMRTQARCDAPVKATRFRLLLDENDAESICQEIRFFGWPTGPQIRTVVARKTGGRSRV